MTRTRPACSGKTAAAPSTISTCTGASETPITPIMVGEAATAHAFSRELFDEGLYATGIGYPTVPQGKARIRTIVTAAHSPDVLERAIEILTRVATRMRIIG